MSNAAIPLPNLDDAAKAIKDLTSAIQGLQGALGSLGGQSGGLAMSTGNIFKNLTANANTASGAMKTLFSQMTGGRPAGTSLGSLLDYGMQGDFGHDIAMFPLRFMQSTISANRQLAYNSASALSGMQYAQNRGMAGMLGSMSGQMGTGGNRYGLRGTADEVTQMFATARQYGAMYDFATPVGTAQPGVRTEGFFKGTAELANMYPGANLGQLASTLGSFSANTAAQQRSLFMSGGAFGMIGQGGKQKTVSQWAESILQYMKMQRFGPDRGKDFTYGELLSQNFPGSNIDAWLDINGVPPDMKEVWWNYVMAKTTRTTAGGPSLQVGTTAGGVMDITPNRGNLATERALAVSASARPQLQLAQAMNRPYITRERSNTEFNKAMGQFTKDTVQGSFVTDLIAKMPDPIEEFVMQFLENSGTFGSLVGGMAGYGHMGMNLMSHLFSTGGLFGNAGINMADILASITSGGLPGLPSDVIDAITAAGSGVFGGDVGDVGDWGAMGGTGTASLHPDMNRKISAMMKANPRLRINSGRRDEVTQRSLKGKGFSRVSGKSSAHTRGLAADLGPASQYGWIMANASKFGLRSGADHGEPWHVGMSGIGDTTTSNASISSIFAKMFSGLSYDDVSSILPAFFTMLSPLGGGPKQTQEDIEKRYADDSDTMHFAKDYTVGGTWGGTDFADYVKSLKTAAGQQTHTTEGGGNTTLKQALQSLGISSTGLSDGAMVALLANKAGFTGKDLVTAVAIAGRESHFNPSVHAVDSDDDSYGLWQINMLPSAGGAGRRQRYGISPDSELLDPWVNAQVMHGIAYENSTPFYAWGPYRGDPPTQGTDVNAATGYVREAGLSTVGDVDGWNGGGSVSVGGARMSFNNTFVINGGGSGGGGIDVRRTASQIADQLERQMQSRLERVN